MIQTGATEQRITFLYHIQKWESHEQEDISEPDYI